MQVKKVHYLSPYTRNRYSMFTKAISLCILSTHKFNLLPFLDPYEDQFEKRGKEKMERVAKNEYQRLRNIARNKKIPGKRCITVARNVFLEIKDDVSLILITLIKNTRSMWLIIE